jgi:hypothetical protein
MDIGKLVVLTATIIEYKDLEKLSKLKAAQVSLVSHILVKSKNRIRPRIAKATKNTIKIRITSEERFNI